MKIIVSCIAFLSVLASCNPTTLSHFVEGEATVIESLVAEEAADLEAGLAVPSRPTVVPVSKK